jgi:hypothetical protein
VRGLVRLALLSAAFGALVEPAHAAIRLPRLDAPELEVVLGDVGRVHLPPPAPIKVLFGGKYGTGSEIVERQLQAATDREIAAVTRDNLQAPPENVDKLKQCVSTGLKGTASNYQKALTNSALTGESPVWPTFDEDLKAGISPCLQTAFPDAPSAVIDQWSSYLASQGAQYAQQALEARSAAAVFIRWMNTTADDFVPANEATTTSTEPSEPAGGGAAGQSDSESGSSSDGGSSFPWWAVLLGLVVVGGLGVWGYQSRARR